MGIVAYRDIGDEYVTKAFTLTTDIQDLYANLLELKARGGGDWPESVNEALHVGGDQAQVDARAPEFADPVPGRRRAAAHGLRPGHQNTRSDKDGARSQHHGQRGAGRQRATPNGCGATSPNAATAATSRSRRTAATSSSSRRRDIEIIELQGNINGTVIPYGPRATLECGAEGPTSTAARQADATEMAGHAEQERLRQSGRRRDQRRRRSRQRRDIRQPKARRR